jgi:hypothetical protein
MGLEFLDVDKIKPAPGPETRVEMQGECARRGGGGFEREHWFSPDRNGKYRLQKNGEKRSIKNQVTR